MTKPEPKLTFEDLFGADVRNPDALFDRWLAGELDPAREEAVLEHLLGSTHARDEAMLRLLVREGASRSASARNPLVEAVRVAVRLVQGSLEVLASSIRALPAQAVPVRTGEIPARGTRSFAIDSLGVGARLHIRPASESRFGVSVEPGAASDTEWVMLGEGGRMVTADADTGTVLFSSVGPGLWSLEHRDGQTVSASIEIQLDS